MTVERGTRRGDEKARVSDSDQIRLLEAELAKTKYNKRTQHHIGLVKAKIARLKDKEAGRGKGTQKGQGYSVRKSGDATVIIVGFPSVGKSTLLNSLTNAKSEVGSYDFTTLDVIPADMHYKHARIQLLDVPGIVRGAASGRGRGREVLAVMRAADLIVIVVDVNYPGHYRALLKEIADSGIRINQREPDVKLRRTIKDGIDIGATVRLTRLRRETITDILKEFRIMNAQVTVREDIDADQLIDVIEGNRAYIPAVTVLNKIDMVGEAKIAELVRSIRPDLCISAKEQTHIDELRDRIYDRLDLMRVYCKEVGKKADMEVPLIMKRGDTVLRVCDKLHKDFARKFRFARVWGPSAKFPGQKLMQAHPLADGDVVELHIR
ncbi:GTP-binding protein [Candidatus Woesearchaeota archaeon]|nr:GTP-binding protein [Candidatus Woesearchaeota archaeon]